MTIALATMVKNEEAVIEQMLTSALPLIDRVIMLDTGSTDNTIAVARTFCDNHNLPFDLVEHPFDNFGASRTRLLAFAKGQADWIFMLDADWTVELTGQYTWEHMKTVFYDMDETCKMVSSYSLIHGEAVEYWQPHFIRGDQDWRYIGAAHEYLARTEASVKLAGLRVVGKECDPATRRARSHRNLKLLLASLAEDPTNSRTYFYLGRTYRELKLDHMARPFFLQRAAMGGWDEEAWFARCEAAYCLSPTDPLELWEAWAARPTRAEPLFWLARAYHLAGEDPKALIVNRLRETISLPKDDILFVDTAAYGPTK